MTIDNSDVERHDDGRVLNDNSWIRVPLYVGGCMMLGIIGYGIYVLVNVLRNKANNCENLQVYGQGMVYNCSVTQEDLCSADYVDNFMKCTLNKTNMMTNNTPTYLLKGRGVSITNFYEFIDTKLSHALNLYCIPKFAANNGWFGCCAAYNSSTSICLGNTSLTNPNVTYQDGAGIVVCDNADDSTPCLGTLLLEYAASFGIRSTMGTSWCPDMYLGHDLLNVGC